MNNKPVRYIRAGELPPIDIPQLHRVDASQLPGDIYFSEPPGHVSTDETRKVRASFFRRVILPCAIVMTSILSAVVIAIF